MKVFGSSTMAAIAVVFIGSVATAQAPKKQIPPAGNGDQPMQQQQPPPMQPKQPMQRQQKQNQMRQQPMTDQATLKDIESTIGFVPQWMRQVPAVMLPSFWATIRDVQLSDNTALDRKTKELVGLGVAAQIPCDYCVAFHTEAARAAGATDQEIREAVGMAAITREASTILNGSQIDKNQFRRDLDRMIKRNGNGAMKQQAQR